MVIVIGRAKGAVQELARDVVGAVEARVVSGAVQAHGGAAHETGAQQAAFNHAHGAPATGAAAAAVAPPPQWRRPERRIAIARGLVVDIVDAHTNSTFFPPRLRLRTAAAPVPAPAPALAAAAAAKAPTERR